MKKIKKITIIMKFAIPSAINFTQFHIK